MPRSLSSPSKKPPHQAEIDAWRQRQPSSPPGIEALALLFAELVKAVLFENLFQLPVEGMPRRLDPFGLADQHPLPLPKAVRHEMISQRLFRHSLLAHLGERCTSTPAPAGHSPDPPLPRGGYPSSSRYRTERPMRW